MAIMNYQDFDLKITKVAGERHEVFVRSQFGKASTEFGHLISEEEMKAFVSGTGRPRRASRHIGGTEQVQSISPKDLGARLYGAVFTGVVADLLRGSLRIAEKQNAGLRIRLDLTEAPDLMNLPWEFMYDAASARFLSLSVETPIVRRLPIEDSVEPLAAALPLRVLVMISGPQDYPDLDVEQEWVKLQESVADLEQRGLLQLERMQSATLAELQRRLRQEEYHILHFIGHGGFDDQEGDGVLVLESDVREGRPTSAEFLGTLLRDAKTIQLVVLNACEGGRTSHVEPFAGAAQSLLRQDVPSVVAMQFEITDRAAIIFSREFYAAIADGYPVDSAIAEARKAIYADQNVLEWGTPALYLNAPDGRVFELESSRPTPVDPEPVQESLDQGIVGSVGENAGQAAAEAKGSGIQQLFAGKDSIGFRIGRWSAGLAMLGAILAEMQAPSLGVFVIFVFLFIVMLTGESASSATRRMASWLWVAVGVPILVRWFGVGADDALLPVVVTATLLVQVLITATLLVQVLISAMLARVRPVSRGYRTALAGAGLGLGSTVILLFASRYLAPDLQAAAPAVPGSTVFFCVLLIWLALDNVSGHLAIGWQDTRLVVMVGTALLVWTIFEAALRDQSSPQWVFGHITNVVAAVLIILGGRRNKVYLQKLNLSLAERQAEISPSPATVTGQAAGESNRDVVQRSKLTSSDKERLIIDHPIHLELVPVPAGEFTMGNPIFRGILARLSSLDEQPQHQLYLPRFYMGKYPVTNQQYAVFVEATDHPMPEYWDGGRIQTGMELHPVTGVSRQDALAFCQWLSKETDFVFRLPTEAEWEKAARGSDGRLYPWGDEPPTPYLCNFKDTGIKGTTPVDRFVDTASPYGVLDLSGNVKEWTSSIYRDYPYNRSDGRETLITEGDFDLVQRGGCFDSAALYVRSSKRFAESRGVFDNVGFRVAVTL